MKPSQSENRCLKGLSSIRRPSQCQTFKDRVIVLLGDNVASYKLKYFVIWYSEKLMTFKRISKHTLPISYRNIKKSWMTQLLFQDALLNCYVSKMETYSLHNNTHFKNFLIADNTPRCPPFIGYLHPNSKVMFLSLNTQSLIQPINQGVVAAFQGLLLRRTCIQAIAAT